MFRKIHILSFFLIVVALVSCNQAGQEESKSSSNDSLKAEISVPDTTVKSSQSTNDKILGIDVSHFDGDIDWEQVKRDTLIWVYSKATEGITYTDPLFSENRQGAQEAGVLFGAYHFYVSDDSPEDQVNNFIHQVGQLNKGELPPVLDLEEGGIKGTLDKPQFQKDVLAWLSEVEKQIGVKPIIYVDNSFANTYLTDSIFATYDLWIAEYNSSIKEPNIPKTWSMNGKTWLMWQKSAQGSYKGIQLSDVDHDVFNGTLDQLKEITKK